MIQVVDMLCLFACLSMYVVHLDHACTMATIIFLEIIFASDECSLEFPSSIVDLKTWLGKWVGRGPCACKKRGYNKVHT